MPPSSDADIDGCTDVSPDVGPDVAPDVEPEVPIADVADALLSEVIESEAPAEDASLQQGQSANADLRNFKTEEMTFGSEVRPAPDEDEEPWVPTESMQNAAPWRGYLENYDADWAAFLAAVHSGAGGADGEERGMEEGSVIAAGFGVFLTSPRRGGKLWTKAAGERRRNSSKAGEFGVEDNPADWIEDPEDCEGEGMRMESDIGELLLEVLRFARPVGQSEGYVGFKKCENEVLRMADRVEALKGSARNVMAECLCMEVVGPLLYLIVETVETGEDATKDGARRLLRFVAEEAKAREVHVMVKVALGRISWAVMSAVTGMLVDSLVDIWATVVPRVVGKRSIFLKDVVDVLDRVVFMSDGDIIERRVAEKARSGGKKGEGEDKEGDDDVGAANDLFTGGEHPSKRERALLKFVGDLAAVQKAQITAQAAARADRGVVEGRDDPEVIPLFLQNTIGLSRFKAKDQMKELRKAVEVQETSFHDFETERGATLALLFKLVVQVVQRLPPPIGKESPGEREAKAGPLLKFLDETMPLFEEFGIENAVDTCQKTQQIIAMIPLSVEDAVVAQITLPKLRRNRKTETLFGIDAVSSYLVVSLGLAKGNLLSGKGIKSSAGFDLLSPKYAMDLTMAFIMHLVSHRSTAVSMAGIRMLSAMMADVGDKSLGSMVAILRTPHEFTVSQTDCSWFGICSVLTKAVPRFDDPLLRTFAYKTLQAVLLKMSPPARFDVLEVLLLDTSHHVMAGQLITELKNVLPVLDAECAVALSMERYTRFVDHVVPRYLLPRQEYLAGLQPATSACSAAYFIALRDCARLAKETAVEGDGAVGKEVAPGLATEIRSRLTVLRDYLDLGRRALEATGSVIQVDLRKSKLEVDYKVADKPQMKEAAAKAERDLNLAGTALASLEPALELLKEALDSE